MASSPGMSARATSPDQRSLLGVRPALQDQLAQRGSSWADRSGLATNALDRPVSVTPMARRHVLGHRGVPMVAAGPQMSSDPLTLQKDLNSARCQPHLDFAAGKAVRNAVEMALGLDMVVDANPAEAPLEQSNRAEPATS